MKKTDAETKKSTPLKTGVILVIVLLILAVSWLIVWKTIKDSLTQAEKDATYAAFSVGDAVYEECDLSIVKLYDANAASLTKEICGSAAGNADFADASFPLFHLAALENAAKRDGILLMEYGEYLRAYELVGFTTLGSEPNIEAVCEAYGIDSAAAIVSVTAIDNEGNESKKLTSSDEISRFYEKFVKLGKSISAAEQSKAYYDAYVEKYGSADDLVLEGESLTAESDETKSKAYELFGDGMLTIGMELANGLQITGMVYAPTVNLFTAFGCYRAADSPIE